MAEFKKPDWSLYVLASKTKLNGLNLEELRFVFSILSPSERKTAVVWRPGMTEWSNATSALDLNTPFEPPGKLDTPKSPAIKTANKARESANKLKPRKVSEPIPASKQKPSTRPPLRRLSQLPKKAPKNITREKPDFDKTEIDFDPDPSERTRIYRPLPNSSPQRAHAPLKIEVARGAKSVSKQIVSATGTKLVLNSPLPPEMIGPVRVKIHCALGELTYQAEVVEFSKIKLVGGRDLEKFSNWITMYFS